MESCRGWRKPTGSEALANRLRWIDVVNAILPIIEVKAKLFQSIYFH